MEIVREQPTVPPVSHITLTPYEANELRLILGNSSVERLVGPTLQKVRAQLQAIKSELEAARP
jgi:hypothetical protein